MNSKSDKTWVHLVLGGGGVLSLSYAGALSVLHENDIKFSSVSCCSAGTFIGALLSERGTPEGLVEDVLKLSLERLEGRRALRVPGPFDLMVNGPLAFNPMLRWPFAMFDKAGFPEVLQELLGYDPTFSDLDIRFATAGFDIVQKRFLVYASDTHPDMKVSKALAIAVSIPYAYPPYVQDGRIVLDAGVASECPVWMAADQDPGLPIVALRPRRRPAAKAHLNKIETFTSETLGSIPRGIDDYIISQMSRVKLLEIDCEDIPSSRFDLSDGERRFLIDAGRREAEGALQRFGQDFSIEHKTETAPLIGDPDDVMAFDKGDFLMTRFHQDLSKEVTNRVFISYSHKDKKWLERIKDVFKNAFPLTRTWDDTVIDPGDFWRPEIENALAKSRVAVLLLSQDFFDSDFITKNEVPPIIEASRAKKITAYPVFLSAADAGWNASPLKKIQVVNPDRPLDSISKSECEKILIKIANKIRKKIQVG